MELVRQIYIRMQILSLDNGPENIMIDDQHMNPNSHIITLALRCNRQNMYSQLWRTGNLFTNYIEIIMINN